jgi:hypothetical protein
MSRLFYLVASFRHLHHSQGVVQTLIHAGQLQQVSVDHQLTVVDHHPQFMEGRNGIPIHIDQDPIRAHDHPGVIELGQGHFHQGRGHLPGGEEAAADGTAQHVILAGLGGDEVQAIVVTVVMMRGVEAEVVAAEVGIVGK